MPGIGLLTFETFEDALRWLLDEAVDYELQSRTAPVKRLSEAHLHTSELLFVLAWETEWSVSHGYREDAYKRLISHGYRVKNWEGSRG